jgi:hypothetical protein
MAGGVISGFLPPACLIAVLPSILLLRPPAWALWQPEEAVPIPALAANVMSQGDDLEETIRARETFCSSRRPALAEREARSAAATCRHRLGGLLRYYHRESG